MVKIKDVLARNSDVKIKIDDGTNKEIKLGSEWLKEFPYSDGWLFIDFARSKDDTHYVLTIG